MAHESVSASRRNGAAQESHSAESDQLSEMAENFSQMAQEYVAPAREAISKFKPFMEKSMKEKPLATLAGAAVVCFILGALWRK